jgi:hypothetical protein
MARAPGGVIHVEQRHSRAFSNADELVRDQTAVAVAIFSAMLWARWVKTIVSCDRA